MPKKILTVLAAAAALLIAVVSARPAQYRVERSALAAAPPPLVWGRIADFRRWRGWSPWARLDPGMSVEFGGSPAETGSTYHWSGNDKVGEGRMTIVEQRPPERLVIRLEFLRPWSQTSTTTFALAPEGAGTRITWAMSGESDFLGKLTSLFLSFDRMVGPDFERGLAALAEQAAAEARAGASALSSPAPGP